MMLRSAECAAAYLPLGLYVPDVVPSSTHAVALGAILIQPATDLPLFSDRVSQ